MRHPSSHLAVPHLVGAVLLISSAALCSSAAQTPASEIPRPALPAPPVADNAPPSAFLRAAQTAMITGRLGEAQEALEMAQTRMLDRSVPLFQTGQPSPNPAVKAVANAIQALVSGDRETALRHIQTAMATADDVAR